MKLFNKTIDRQLFKQYSLGSDFSKQEVVVKIFNPQGAGSWFILNSDPQDPDYLWAIVDLGYGAEVGSVSRSDLETYTGRFGLGFERDLGFDPINAEELYNGLRQGKYYADGGETKGKDTWQNIFEEFGFKKGRSMYGLNMYYKKGYIASVDHELRNVELMFEDNVIYKGYSIQVLLSELENQFGKMNFADGGEIEVVYERRADFKKKPIKLLLLSRGKEQKGYTFSGKDQVAVLDNYNRNEQEDLKKLWNLKGYETKYADGGKVNNFDEDQKFENFKNSLIKYSDKYELGEGYNPRYKGLKNKTGDTSTGEYLIEGNNISWNYLDKKGNIYSSYEIPELIIDLRGKGVYLGKRGFAKGGNIADFTDNQQMIMNQNIELEHHHEELEDILEDKVPVPAWVVAKMATATQSISDVTHYLDGEKELMEDEDEDKIKDKEVIEPIIVTAGNKTEITKNFTDDAMGNLKGFLKGMEGIDLREDYTFDYKDEQYEVEPIINSDENGVSNAVFTIFNGDSEEVGEITYSSDGGKQKFTANSELFVWNNTKFEDGGFMNNVYANGGVIIYKELDLNRRDGKTKITQVTTEDNYREALEKIEELKSKNKNPNIRFYTGNIYRADGGFMNGVYADGGNIKKYILKADIKTVTVKRKGKEVTYKGADVLNGAHVLAKGGDITSKANYVGKNDVVEVELKDGSKIKPVNGYWIKKGAEPITSKQEFTSKDLPKDGSEIKITAPKLGYLPEIDLILKYDSKNFRFEVYEDGVKKDVVGEKEVLNNLNSGIYVFTDKPTITNLSKSQSFTEKELDDKLALFTKSDKEFNRLQSESNKEFIKKTKLEEERIALIKKGIYNTEEIDAKINDAKEKYNLYSEKAMDLLKKYQQELIQAKNTSSVKSETKVGETYIRKDMRNNWKAETNIDNFNGYDWRVSTIKTYSGKLISSAQGGKTEATGSKGIVMFKYTMYEDPNYTLEVSTPKRLTDKLVSEQHEKALTKFKKFMETGMFKGGGKISNFDKLSAKVAEQYEGKPVKSQYQEEYGKFYSKEEAQEVGDKVAGKMKAMQPSKKEMGGETKKMSNASEMLIKANQLAKEIRKDGESWNDAKKRAFAQLKK